MVRSWYSNQDDPNIKLLLICNLRSSKELADKMKDFMKAREPCLSGLLFIENNTTICMRWQIEDIYNWFLEHKYYIASKDHKQSANKM